MTTRKDANELLGAIRQKFLHRLKEWQPIFEDFSVKIKENDLSSINLEEIRTKFHQLAGSAKTFGFTELNNHSARIELFLDQLILETPLESISKDLSDTLAIFLDETHANITCKLKTDADDNISIRKALPHYEDYDFHVLIADDDELVRDLLKQGLEENRCKVLQATDGIKVLEMLKKSTKSDIIATPDLIVLDVNMPGMNGFEVLEALKASEDTQSIPIIMLTRRNEDSSVIKGISSGAMDYILKPFQISDLIKRIMNALNHYKTSVLIADDDEMIRDLLSQHFNRLGYIVLTATNGNEAVACMQTKQPDVTLLDIMMPSVDGMAILKQIRANPATENLAVIMLTAKNQQKNVLEGLESGANDYITKPFDVDEVVARVSGILRRRKKI